MLRMTSIIRASRRALPHGLPWSMVSNYNRYAHCFLPYLTPRKLANALMNHTEMMLGRAHVWSTPYMLRIEPTNVCNLRCPGCATGLGLNPRPKGFLGREGLATVLDQIAPHLLLTRLDGLGEPFLHPEICEIIAMAHRAGSATAVSSHFGENTLKPGQADALIEAGLDHLIVSIDGPDQASYEKYRVGGKLDVVLEHIRELVAARSARGSRTPFIEVQFVGFNHNRHLYDQMPALAASVGADRTVGKLVEEHVLRERSAREGAGRRCFWLYSTWTVGWDGERKLCPNSITDTFDLVNAFSPQADLMADQPLLTEVRAFLASRRRDISSLSHRLGSPDSQGVPWRVPRGTDMCRCLACGGVGLVIDRTRQWLDGYVCM